MPEKGHHMIFFSKGIRTSRNALQTNQATRIRHRAGGTMALFFLASTGRVWNDPGACHPVDGSIAYQIMSQTNPYSNFPIVLWSALCFFISLPADSLAGPIPGRKVGTYTRSASKGVPKTLKYRPKGSATASNPSDPMAMASTQVTGTARDSRTKERFRYTIKVDGNGNLIVTAKGLINLEQKGGGSRLTPVKISGRGPAVITSNSIGTNNGVGKIGSFTAGFTAIAISRTPGKLEVRLNFLTKPNAPTGRKFSFFFKS